VSGPSVDLHVALPRTGVLCFLDYPEGHEPPERIELLLAEVLPEARALIAPRGSWVELPVAEAAEVGLDPLDADALVIGLVTAGPALEARVQELLDAGAMTRALLLDAAGSAAAEEAADRLGVHITGGEARPAPDKLTCRLSPGYGRWPLTSQTALFDRLPHADLGVTLTPSLMMVPRKSISFAMWLGARERPAAGLAGCATCTLAHCRYRHARRQPTPRGPQ